MRRREFIAGLGGAVVWPLGVRAQQVMTATVGFLSGRSPAEASDALAAFRKSLSAAGFDEGRNMAVEYRWAQGQYDQLPEMATDLVRRAVKVIVASGGDSASQAAKVATETIPIVFLYGSDPISSGLVSSLNRPGGNATGLTLLTTDLEAKRLEVLHETIPQATVVAVLVNSTNPNAASQAQEVQQAAGALGLQLRVVNASSERDLDAAFKTAAEQRAEAIQVASDALFISSRKALVMLAARYGIPVIYHTREMPAAGGLMSYGTSISDLYGQLGLYASRILKGERPGDLPVMQPTKFDLVINLKTAKTLGITVPPSILARADEVIE
jgi:putative tryptophan/tyrosine transport system substrate-binding protein